MGKRKERILYRLLKFDAVLLLCRCFVVVVLLLCEMVEDDDDVTVIAIECSSSADKARTGCGNPTNQQGNLLKQELWTKKLIRPKSTLKTKMT